MYVVIQMDHAGQKRGIALFSYQSCWLPLKIGGYILIFYSSFLYFCFCEIYFADFPFYHCTNVFFLFYIFFVLHVVHYTVLLFGRMFHAMLGNR